MHGVEVIKVIKTLEIGGRCEDEPEMFHAMYGCPIITHKNFSLWLLGLSVLPSK